MGVDFTAIIGHHFTAGDLAALADPLAPIEPSVRALEAYMEEAPEPWRSSFPLDHSELGRRFRERLHLYVRRGGVGLAVGHHLIKVHHVCRWHYFATHPTIALHLRRLCQALARWGQTDCAVYLPDQFAVEAFDLAFEGRTMDETLQLLREKVGPPAKSIAETVVVGADGSRRSHHYYIDRFNDLADSGPNSRGGR